MIKYIPISKKYKELLGLPDKSMWKIYTIHFTDNPSEKWKDLVSKCYGIEDLDAFLDKEN